MTDWNERYKKGDTPWEKGSAAPPLRELLGKVSLGIWGGGTVLVPGCGSGHDVRALSENGITVLGLDLADEAVKRAGEFVKTGIEKYEKGDFVDTDWRAGKQFSAIWEHTCYCAIDPSLRPDYAEACAAIIRSGGHLIGVFFLTPHDPGEETGGPPFSASIEELDERFGPWFERIEAWVPESAYPGRDGREWLAIYRRK